MIKSLGQLEVEGNSLTSKDYVYKTQSTIILNGKTVDVYIPLKLRNATRRTALTTSIPVLLKIICSAIRYKKYTKSQRLERRSKSICSRQQGGWIQNQLHFFTLQATKNIYREDLIDNNNGEDNVLSGKSNQKRTTSTGKIKNVY